MNIRVSVVIPAYNVEKYIGKTLGSVIHQTLRPIEVIVINDGSTDRTSKIAKEILSKSDVCWQVIDQPNQGVSVARNIGVGKSSGEYIMFLDSDDFLGSNNVLESLYNEAKSFDCDIVFCKYSEVDEMGIVLKSYEQIFPKSVKFPKHTVLSGRGVCVKVLKEEVWIWTGNAIYKRDFLVEKRIEHPVGISVGEILNLDSKHCMRQEELPLFLKYLSVIYNVKDQ